MKAMVPHNTRADDMTTPYKKRILITPSLTDELKPNGYLFPV